MDDGETILIESTDPLGMYLGPEMVRVHSHTKCWGSRCSIHNPSAHHMKSWKQLWRDDRKLMERICPEHGIGHPDPDHMWFIRASCGNARANVEGVHGCCGCCVPPDDADE